MHFFSWPFVLHDFFVCKSFSGNFLKSSTHLNKMKLNLVVVVDLVMQIAYSEFYYYLTDSHKLLLRSKKKKLKCVGSSEGESNTILYAHLAEQPRLVAFYPLNGAKKGKDITRRNPPARLRKVTLSPGPDGNPKGSYSFKGNRNSYIQLPNRGNIDTEGSITILAWILPRGNDGPIVNFHPSGWGVHFWIVNRNRLFVRFSNRKGRRSTRAVVKKGIRINR